MAAAGEAASTSAPAAWKHERRSRKRKPAKRLRSGRPCALRCYFFRTAELISNLLRPQGADVRLREKSYNPETGKQIGELDITVRGDFGASTFFCAIECRDRPAEGPQGLSWITQIVGKKRLLNPDKMIGVSGTGFTDDTQASAAAEGRPGMPGPTC